LNILRSLWRDRLQRDTFLLLCAQVFYKLTGVFIIMLLSRSLSPTEIGVFFFATSFAESCLTLTGVHIGPLLMRRVAADPASAAIHFGAVLGLRLVSGVVFLAVVTGAAFFFAYEVWQAVVIAALFTLCEALYCSFGTLFVALKKTLYNVSIGVWVQAVFLLAFLLAVRKMPSLQTVLNVNLLRNGMLVVAACVVAHFWLFPLRVRWDRALIAEGWPFAVVHVLVAIRNRSDTLLLGFLTDYLHVGHYQLAYQFVFSSLFVPVVITSVFFPHIAAEGISPQTRQLLLSRIGTLVLIGCWAGLMNEEETREAGRRKERHPICSAGASKEGLVSEQRWS